jgi:rhodanese-related sulfurtransferase
MKAISSQKLQQRIATGNPVRVLDVRTAPEYASGHIPQAVLEPLDRFDATRVARTLENKGDELYVICHSGTRARKAITRLEAAGLTNCVLVEGGMSAWIKAGFEVERQGKGVISLERQVRIAAGLLVLCGTLLGTFVHPALLVVPGAVGAGLIFAGVSDICGMGMLLARMPWNQVNSPVASPACCQVRS